MKLYYYTANNDGNGIWVNRWVQAHQVLVSWNEAQATKDNRLTGTPWNALYGKIGGTVPPADDANGQYESKVLFWQNEGLPTWKSWDLTALTQKWVNGTPNYGVILWATNEDVAGYTMRFYSSEATNSYDRPYLYVIWSNQPKTVYFLKDHLGSVRATVLDSATAPVIGYDDYDAWGYPLALRTKAIPNAYLQGASKNKFTGKERDEDFGLNLDYFEARYYDWLIGRWISVDPLGLKHPNVSPYAYVLNNPMILVDPNGQQVFAAGPAPRYVMFNSIVQNLMSWKPRHTKDYNAFLDHIQGKSLEQVTHETDRFSKTDYSAGGPFDNFKFIKDPAAPNRIIDMRHFIVIGQLGQGTLGLLKANAYGLLVELGQIAKGNLESGGSREDFYSNYLGSIFFHDYYDPKLTKTFDQQLREWLEERKKLQEEKQEEERRKKEKKEQDKEKVQN